MTYNCLPDIRRDLFNGSISLSDLVAYYVENCFRNADLNAYIELYREDILKKAGEIQEKIRQGRAGKLAGLIFSVKDNICYRGHRSTASSAILREYVSSFTATALERMLNEDALVIGRTNCDEFAMGGTNETSAYGPVLNPLNRTLVPGGSSGGAAASVAADTCLAAIGSDTGGSIRQPASFCGLAGLKPTYGRVSRHGLIAYGSSFDQIGPITRNIEDAAIILEVIAGHDDFDSTCSRQQVPPYSSMLDFKGKIKAAFLKQPLEHEGLDPEIRERTADILKKLVHEGHTAETVDFPLLDYLVPAYYVMTTAEASSNLARYDGMHFGHRTRKKTDLTDTIVSTRSEAFGTEVKRRIMTGTFVLSAGYYDAYYARAQKVRRMIADKTREIFSHYDFILLPTTPRTAFPMGTMGDDPVALYLEDIFTIFANLSGIPAVTIPAGRHSNGMPFGIQVCARHFREGELLAFAQHLLETYG